jgi:hypothetical protein
MASSSDTSHQPLADPRRQSMNLFQTPIAPLVSILLAITPGALQAQAPQPEAAGAQSVALAYAKHGPYWVGTRGMDRVRHHDGRQGWLRAVLGFGRWFATSLRTGILPKHFTCQKGP